MKVSYRVQGVIELTGLEVDGISEDVIYNVTLKNPRLERLKSIDEENKKSRFEEFVIFNNKEDEIEFWKICDSGKHDNIFEDAVFGLYEDYHKLRKGK